MRTSLNPFIYKAGPSFTPTLAILCSTSLFLTDGDNFTEYTKTHPTTYTDGYNNQFIYREGIAVLGVSDTSSTNVIEYSTDNCTSWTSVNSVNNAINSSITWNGSLYIRTANKILDQNLYYRSTDGISWTNFTVSGVYLYSSYNNGYWHLGGVQSTAWDSQGRIAYSTNGTSWTTVNIANTSGIFNVAYGAGKWVGVGNTRTTGRYFAVTTSTNGSTWASRTNISTMYTARKVVFGNSKFVAAGLTSSATTQKACISTSTNGTSWTTAVQIPTSEYTTSCAELLFDGVYFYILVKESNSSYVITGIKLFKSSDAVTWTDISVANMKEISLIYT